MKLKIPQATKTGSIECSANGVFDWTYPTSKSRRGRVQEGGAICPTIMHGQSELIVFEVRKYEHKTH